MKRQRILIAAGGTGGHLLPAQQLSSALEKRADLLFAGHRLGESAFFRRDHFSFHSIEAAPLVLSPKGLIRFAAISCRSVWQALKLLRSYQPDLVIGFGSFHAFPILAAAALLRKEILLFEANCQIGKVNRLFAPFATYVAAQFPFPGKIELVPLLPWKEKTSTWNKAAAREKYGLDPTRTTCLVFGGSQGAAFLNKAAPFALPASVQAIHLSGKEERLAEVERLYAEAGVPVAVKAYEAEMESAYAAADFAICRSGASTIAELIEHELPALLIPFPYSTDGHQIANGRFLAKIVGGGIMMLEQEANRESMQRAALSLLERAAEHRQSLAAYRQECKGRESFAEKIMRGQ